MCFFSFMDGSKANYSNVVSKPTLPPHDGCSMQPERKDLPPLIFRQRKQIPTYRHTESSSSPRSLIPPSPSSSSSSLASQHGCTIGIGIGIKLNPSMQYCMFDDDIGAKISCNYGKSIKKVCHEQ